MGGSDAVVRLVASVEAYWSLNLYEAAAEAGGCFVRPLKQPRTLWGAAADPERAKLEAGRRARARLRRFCVANRLNRLGTLTYAGSGCHDPRQVRADVGEFFRALRKALGGGPFAYAWVTELHKSGHGLHVHFAVGGFVPRGKIEQAWGRGFVSIKLLGDLPVGSGSLEQARKAAAYLGKYVSKSFADEDERNRPKGSHRFDVAQGFTPRPVSLQGVSACDVLLQACDLMGGYPLRSWSSGEVKGWQGAPAVWFQW